MSLFDELKRRNVFRVAIAYLASAWLLIEVADTILPRLGFSDSAVTNVILVLAIGFIPTLILSWIFELTPEGLRRDSNAGPGSSIAARTGKKLDRLIIVTLVLAVGFLAIDKFVLDPARDTLEIEAATERGRTDAVLGAFGDKSIAVLAFDDMSPANDQEYLSDSISEELLNLLSPIRELRVISRSSAFSFKDSSATLQEIAEKLKVSYIVEGSVRKSGDRIRITAQLIDARTDAHVWSQTYDRTLNDVFAIQDEISASIVEQLRIALLGELPKSTEIDMKAYELYLKARHIVHTEVSSQFREAQALLIEALAIEPDYIPALNELGRLYYRIPVSEGASFEQNDAEIQALADRVVAIDPNGMSALIWQGWFAYRRDDLREAAGFYEKAMSIDPNNVDLLRVVTLFLIRIGRTDEAIAMGNYLLLRDPSCGACIGNLAYAYQSVGRHEESARELEEFLSWHAPSGGSYWSIGVSWLLAGFPDRALAAFELESLEGNREMGTIMALHDLGRMDEFETRFAILRNDAESGGEAEAIARIYAWIGSNDEAFEWLNKGVELDGPKILAQIDTDLYAKIKPDPRWRTLRDKYVYHDEPIEPVEAIEFRYTLPTGVSND